MSKDAYMGVSTLKARIFREAAILRNSYRNGIAVSSKQAHVRQVLATLHSAGRLWSAPLSMRKTDWQTMQQVARQGMGCHLPWPEARDWWVTMAKGCVITLIVCYLPWLIAPIQAASRGFSTRKTALPCGLAPRTGGNTRGQ